MIREKRRAKHAALVSMAAAPVAPIFFCTNEAVFATTVEGVHVAKIKKGDRDDRLID